MAGRQGGSKNLTWWAPHLLLVGSLVFSAIFVYISTKRTLTGLESTLLQIISLGLGVMWSTRLGAEIAQRDAKPHVRSAFRRTIALYASLARIRSYVTQATRNYNLDREGEMAMRMLESVVIEQISTARDAIADWEEMLSEDEVKDLISRELSLPSDPEEDAHGED